MDFILSPIALYAALGLSVVVCFALFFATSMDVRRRNRQHTQAVTDLKAEMQQEITALREQLQSLQTVKAAETEEVPVAAPAAAPAGSSMNLTRRAQALRLYRLGTDPTEIARRLGLAQGEVRLAVKMHKMLVENNAGA